MCVGLGCYNCGGDVAVDLCHLFVIFKLAIMKTWNDSKLVGSNVSTGWYRRSREILQGVPTNS